MLPCIDYLMESIDPKYEQDVSAVTKNVIKHAFRLSLVGEQKEKINRSQ